MFSGRLHRHAGCMVERSEEDYLMPATEPHEPLAVEEEVEEVEAIVEPEVEEEEDEDSPLDFGPETALMW